MPQRLWLYKHACCKKKDFAQQIVLDGHANIMLQHFKLSLDNFLLLEMHAASAGKNFAA